MTIGFSSKVNLAELNDTAKRVKHNQLQHIKSMSFSGSSIPKLDLEIYNPNSLSKSQLISFGGLIKPKVELQHRLTDTIKHPIYGEIKQYEVFDPKNDVPETRQQVYIIENHDFPQVALGLNILTGSSNETDANNGVSHFLEHLIFKGSDKFGPGEVDKELENLGALVNAYTYYENTCYHAIVPKENFARALEVYANTVQNPAIPPEELQKERSVVVEEIIRSDSNVTSGAYLQLFGKLMEPHPYNRTILGPEKVIRNISREDILAYHKNFYAPSNRQIVIYGDITPDEALKEVKKNFAELEVKPVVKPQRSQPAEAQFETTTKKVEGLDGKSYLFMGFRGPESANVKDCTALNLINIILGQGDSSRLNSDLTEKRQVVLDVGTDITKLRDSSTFMMISYQEEEKTKEVQDLLSGHLKDIIQNGVTEEELVKAKNVFKYGLASDFENPDNFFTNLTMNMANGSIKDDVKTIQTVDELTVKDLQEAVAKYLNPDKAKIFKIASASEESPAKPGQTISFTGNLAPNEKSVKLDNGAELIVKKKAGSLMSAISIHLNSGKRKEEKPGLLHVLTSMLMRGTLDKTIEQLNQELDKNAINIGIDFNTGPNGVVIEAKCLDTQKNNMIKLLSEILTNPRILLDNEEVRADFERQKELFKSDLDNPANRDPGRYTLLNSVYGPDYPSNKVILDNLDKITLEDVIDAYKKSLNPATMAVSAVGDFDISELKTTLNSSLAKLKPSNAGNETYDPKPITDNVVIGVPEDFESRNSQVKIFKAWKAANFDSEDCVALKLLDAVLSGGMSTRLFKAFREDREGLCYSVGSTYVPSKNDGVFMFKVETSPGKLKECLNLFNEEVTKLLTTNKIKPEELQRARNLYKNEILSKMRSSSAVASSISKHRALGIDSITDTLEKIDKLTVDDVQRVAEKYLSKPNITTVQASSAVLKENDLLK